MEHELESHAVHLAPHPTLANVVAVGFADGSIRLYDFETESNRFQSGWTQRLKRAVRAVAFSGDGESLTAISRNRALCLYDCTTGKRIRCIRECHVDRPSALCLLADASGQQWATGDENGVMRTWDLRAPKPVVAEFRQQFDIINAFGLSGPRTLLAACSDGTLGAYCMRRRRSMLVSETMHGDLLSIAVGERYCYVGSGDGHIEVFKVGEWGNILGRIETRHSFGVDCLLMARPDLLLTASSLDSSICLVHVEPNRRLGRFADHHGAMGIQQLAITANRRWLLSLDMETSLRVWDLPEMLKSVPVMRAVDCSANVNGGGSPRRAAERNAFYEGFFDDLIDNPPVA